MAQPALLVEELVTQYAAVPLNFRIFDPEGSLRTLLEFVDDPKHTLIAFDFDQTLTHVRDCGRGQRETTLRGGNESMVALSSLHSQGAIMCIITAQNPSIEVVKLLRTTLRKLQLDKFFLVDDWDRNSVLTYLRSFGSNEEMPLDQLATKLAMLIVMYSSRYPEDLARIGFHPTTFERVGENSNDSKITRVTYRLQQLTEGPSKGTWSAMQYFKVHHDTDEFLCPVACWHAYISRTAHLRSTPIPEGKVVSGAEDFSDRLFISPNSAEPLNAATLVSMVCDVLKASGIPDRHRQDGLSEPARELSIDGGVKISKLGNVMAARYNKPQALEWFMHEIEQKTGMRPRRVVFVDDNSDNVFNVFSHFAKIPDNVRPRVDACWWPPPRDGRSEPFEPAYRAVIERLAIALGPAKGEAKLV